MSTPPLTPDESADGSAEVSAEPTVGHRGRRRTARTVLRTLGAVVLSLVFVLLLGAAYLYRDLNQGINANNDQDHLTNRPPKAEVEGPHEPINILVMGTDSREGANDIDGDKSSGARSDTTILFHLSADRTRAYGISIPRDSLVDRPECPASEGYAASPAAAGALWNAAFEVGGATCTMQQFEQLTQIQLDHHVVVDFDGFKQMVDAIGGVHMCIPQDMVDAEYTHTTIKAGKNRLLDGTEARTYARMRHIFTPEGVRIGDGSDISRTRRQQALVGSIAREAVSAGTLANPFKLRNFLKAVIDSVTVDEGLGNVAKMVGLGAQFKGIGLGHIQFLTIPNHYPPDDLAHVAWTQPAANQIWSAIRHDRAIPDRLLTGVITADDAATGGSGTSPSASPSRTPDPSGKPTLPPTLYDDPDRNGLCS